MLDCELSYGTLRSGRLPWEIRFSTLPWREGRCVNFPNEIKVDPHGLPIPRILTKGWSVPISPFAHDDLTALFPR